MSVANKVFFFSDNLFSLAIKLSFWFVHFHLTPKVVFGIKVFFLIECQFSFNTYRPATAV